MNIRLSTLIIILLISILLLVSGFPKLKFGLDIQGGTMFLFESEKPDKLETIVQTINKRIESFNLLETKTYVSNSTIKIASLTGENLDLLLIPGNFEAKILQEIKFENGTGKIKIGTNVYPIELVDEKLKINNSFYEVNQSFFLEDIEFNLINLTNNSVVVEATIFTNDDVLNVLTRYSQVTYQSQAQVYEFSIPIEISSQASNKFTRIAKGLKTSFAGTQPVLEGFLTYYLDGKQISKLNIPFELSVKELKNIAIIGFGRNQAAVLEEKNKIQAVLESGRLPELKLIGTEKYEPTLRKTAIEISFIGAIAITILTVGLTYFRYKNFKLCVYSISIIASEIVCIFGAIALTQRLFVYGWIVDLQTIFGLIAFAIVSFVHLFFITEHRIKKKELSLQYKYKKIISFKNLLTIVSFILSFSLLFTAWKGFGLALLSGTILSVLITKSLYEEIVTRSFL